MKFLCLSILPLIFLASCSHQLNIFNNSTSTSINGINEHNYNEIENRKLTWNCIFFEANSPYYVYCYSLTCGHCASLKNSVIEYALNNENIYFYEDSKDTILKGNVDDTFGVTSSKQLAIKGFPSLLKIEDETCILNIYGKEAISNELYL